MAGAGLGTAAALLGAGALAAGLAGAALVAAPGTSPGASPFGTPTEQVAPVQMAAPAFAGPFTTPDTLQPLVPDMGTGPATPAQGATPDTPLSVPEPASVVLLGFGAGAACLVRRRAG